LKGLKICNAVVRIVDVEGGETKPRRLKASDNTKLAQTVGYIDKAIIKEV
jgi:hypothetical protein